MMEICFLDVNALFSFVVGLMGKNLNNDYNGCGIIRAFQASLDSWF